MKNKIISLLTLFIISCSGGSGGSLSDSFMGEPAVSLKKITINQNSFSLDGIELSRVKSVKIKRKDLSLVNLEISSKTDNQIIGKISQSISLVANEVFSIILNTASASTVINAVFTFNPKSIPVSSLMGVLGEGGSEGDTIVWDNQNRSWKTTKIGAETYLGAFDASIGGNALETYPKVGDFYLVAKAGTRDLIGNGPSYYGIGDKIIFNGADWDLIKGNSNVNTFNGRSGGVVPAAGDYTWQMLARSQDSSKILGSSLSDINGVDVTTSNPTSGDLLTFDGYNWIPKTLVINNNIDGLTGSLDSSRITNLTSSIQNSPVGIITLQPNPIVIASTDTLSMAISKLQSQITNNLSELNGKVSKNIYDILLNNQAISDILVKINTNTDSIDSLTAKSDSNTNSINVLSVKNDTNTNSINDISSNINGLTNNITTINTNLNSKLNLSGGSLTGPLTLGELRIKSSDNDSVVKISSPSNLSSYNLTLPNGLGIPNQVLTLGNGGQLTWSTPSPPTVIPDINISTPSGLFNSTESTASAINKIIGSLNNKADSTNITQTITAQAITGLMPPVNSNDGANKKYVDDNLVLSYLTKLPPITLSDSTQFSLIKEADSIIDALIKLQNQLFTKSALIDSTQTITANKIVLRANLINDAPANLDISGAAFTRTFKYDPLLIDSSCTGVIDLTKSNSIAITSEQTSTTCTSVNYNISIADGGTYTVVFQDTDKNWGINFTFFSTEGSNPLPKKYFQTINNRSGSHLILSFSRVGDYVYVTSSEI